MGRFKFGRLEALKYWRVKVVAPWGKTMSKKESVVGVDV